MTTYGSLPLETKKPQSTDKALKTLFILGHVLLVAVVFHAGRASFTGTQNFEHAEAIDLVESCQKGQFVGTCEKCKICAEDEYSAGGCSYFKDTFCTSCEPIAHCPQNQIRCSTQDDMFCLNCNPGFWDVDCKPCSMCDLPNGYFEAEACTQDSDTVCQKATECIQDEETETHEYISKQLEYFSDRECGQCAFCPSGTWTEVECLLGSNEKNLLGLDTQCTNCTQCDDDHLVTDTCTIDSDTVCTPCDLCEDGAYITELCQQGDIFNVGEQTVCEDCTPQEEDEWELFGCGGTSDALYRPCATCMDGEFMKQECTNSSDTLCPDCTPLLHCPIEKVTCTDAEDSVCEQCDDGFDGEECCYEKTFGACGTATTRERIAFRYGFEGETNEQFVLFCMDLCQEFPDCLAFEVIDGGEDLVESGQNNLVGKESTCYMKAAYTISPVDPSKDCYSNICRQGIPEGLGFN